MRLSVAQPTIYPSDEQADLLRCTDGKGLFVGVGKMLSSGGFEVCSTRFICSALRWGSVISSGMTVVPGLSGAA